MTEQELENLLKPNNFSVVAPAGHGKTEMIADLVKNSCGCVLLLTHTNAGVDALEKRLVKRHVSKSLYHLTTIAAFCGRWCKAYYRNANFDNSPPLYLLGNSEDDYKRSYIGARAIFFHSWAGSILRASYSTVIVDEYQDCTTSQHEMFLAISKFIPVKIFGDPMQIEFENIPVKTYPWRWRDTNPLLGKYLETLREQLSPCLRGYPCSIHIEQCNGSIEILNPETFNAYALLNDLYPYERVVYITKWQKQQLYFCKRMKGIFQYDEKQECDELFEYSRCFDEKADTELLLATTEFASKCATRISTKLFSYINRLKKGSLDFSRISKYSEFGQLLTECEMLNSGESIIKILSWFQSNDDFKKFRSELLSEMIRSIKYARSKDIPFYEASQLIRMTHDLQKSYKFHFLSSRTLLSKGLEFDCVIIDMSAENPKNRLSAKEFRPVRVELA